MTATVASSTGITSTVTTPAGATISQTVTVDGQQIRLDGPLPVDANVRTGVLDNGLTYILRHNAEPQNRAELRLVVNAGSVLEADDQQGLAHLLEHMMFDGTRRFPKQALIDFMEGVGMQFGADVNASTGYDQTIYELRIPLDDEAVVNKALDIMVDWAGYATLDPAAIDAERGVVVEEHRVRDLNASGRLSDQIMPLLLGDSRYAQRAPIGKMDIVQNAPAETLRRFYETWYRPDLMAVIAVGDFDAAHLESLVRQKFSELPVPKNPVPHPTYEVPSFTGTRYLVATDPENPNTGLQLYFERPAHYVVSGVDYYDAVVSNLFYSMLNQRYVEISRQAGAPFTSATSGSSPIVQTMEANIIAAQLQEQNIVPALDRVLTEVERVRQHGFTASELDRAKADILDFYRTAYDDRDTTDSAQLTDEYIRHFLTDETIPGITFEYHLVQLLLPQITLADVNREIDGLVGENDRVVLAVAPAKPGYTPPTQDDLAGVVKEVASRQLAPYADTTITKPLMAQIPEPAAVVSETTMSEIGVTDVRLANGVRVLMKPTDFNQDEVLIMGRGPGGSSLLPDKDVPAARLISNIVSQSGVGDFTRNDLDRLLAGKNVQVQPAIRELSQRIDASTSPRDLETAFQLINLYVTQPRVDDNAVAATKAAARTALSDRELSPTAALQDAVVNALYGDSIRVQPVIPLADIESLDVQRAFDIYKGRFADMGDFTFVIVGNFKVDEVKLLAQRYLGTLPSSGRVETWKNLLPALPTGVHEQDIYKGNEDRSTVEIIYPGAIDPTPKNELSLSILQRILDIRLREELRTRLSATYSPSVSQGVDLWPAPAYTLAINFTTAPTRTQELVDATFAVAEEMRTSLASDVNMQKAKEQELRSDQESLRQNSYWLDVLGNYAFDPKLVDPASGLTISDLIDKLTAEDVRQAAQQYMPADRYVKITLYPEMPKMIPSQQALLLPAVP